MSLLDDLQEAQAVAVGVRPCPLCDLIRAEEDDVTRAALKDAARGTMGTRKLAEILRRHNTGIGRRTVIRHREEEHTP